MGRHRRSAAGRAAKGRATGVTHTHLSGTGSDDPQDSYAGERRPEGVAPYLSPDAYADANAKSTAYLYAMGGDGAEGAPEGGGFTPGGGPSRTHRRKAKPAKPVRTSLLGISAAVALGSIAVATGVMPGLENYKLGGVTSATGGDQVQAADSPSNTAAAQGGTSGSAENRGGGATGGSGTRRSATPPAPTPSLSTSSSASASASPSPTPAKRVSAKPVPTATPSAKPTKTPSHPATKAPAPTSTPVTVSTRAAAEAEVLKLVNEERAKVGCSALAANSSLTELAEDFSDDMAARSFFDHTDPDGLTPWDRAAKAGITGLGGENIARGQADPAAVMKAWMDSPGHRANILNCDFNTLGVGVHFGPGGPWWTEDFGF
ncbi:CAP domain-containing protein [Streptomyces sp. NPDC002671]